MRFFIIASIWLMLFTSNIFGQPIYENNWIGKYTCSQGLTSFSLINFKSDNDDYHLFYFFADSANPNVPSGITKFSIAQEIDSDKFLLTHNQWILRPKNYRAIDFSGKLSGNTLNGIIKNENCSRFSAEKINKNTELNNIFLKGITSKNLDVKLSIHQKLDNENRLEESFLVLLSSSHIENPNVHFELGKLYYNARGTRKNSNEALRHLVISRDLGKKESLDFIKKILKETNNYKFCHKHQDICSIIGIDSESLFTNERVSASGTRYNELQDAISHTNSSTTTCNINYNENTLEGVRYTRYERKNFREKKYRYIGTRPTEKRYNFKYGFDICAVINKNIMAVHLYDTLNSYGLSVNLSNFENINDLKEVIFISNVNERIVIHNSQLLKNLKNLRRIFFNKHVRTDRNIGSIIDDLENLQYIEIEQDSENSYNSVHSPFTTHEFEQYSRNNIIENISKIFKSERNLQYVNISIKNNDFFQEMPKFESLKSLVLFVDSLEDSDIISISKIKSLLVCAINANELGDIGPLTQNTNANYSVTSPYLKKISNASKGYKGRIAILTTIENIINNELVRSNIIKRAEGYEQTNSVFSEINAHNSFSLTKVKYRTKIALKNIIYFIFIAAIAVLLLAIILKSPVSKKSSPIKNKRRSEKTKSAVDDAYVGDLEGLKQLAHIESNRQHGLDEIGNKLKN